MSKDKLSVEGKQQNLVDFNSFWLYAKPQTQKFL